MYLEEKKFIDVITATPLISIDLIIKNSQNQYLVGLRHNRPAKGCWFVPGGRIRKDESIGSAFLRLTMNELGISLEITEANFIGPYEHFYKDSFSNENISTHYVVLGYEINIDVPLDELPQEQHSQYCWFTKEELLASDDVHINTKNYLLN